jgi:hypothetical protein
MEKVREHNAYNEDKYFLHYYKWLNKIKTMLENNKFSSQISDFKLNYNEINESYLISTDIILTLDMKLLLKFSISYKLRINIDFSESSSYASIKSLNFYYIITDTKTLVDEGLTNFLESNKIFNNYVVSSKIVNDINLDDDLDIITQPLVSYKRRIIDPQLQEAILNDLKLNNK